MFVNLYKKVSATLITPAQIILVLQAIISFMSVDSIRENKNIAFVAMLEPITNAITTVLTLPVKGISLVIQALLPAKLQGLFPQTPSVDLCEGIITFLGALPAIGNQIERQTDKWRVDEVFVGVLDWTIVFTILFIFVGDKVILWIFSVMERSLKATATAVYKEKISQELTSPFQTNEDLTKVYDPDIKPLRVQTNAQQIRPVLQGLISEVQNLQDQVHQDPMTLLYNKGYFVNALKKSLDQARLSREYLGLIFLDVDNFKKLNDTYGHTFGDEVLKAVARVLKTSCTQPNTIPCRYGGEELCVIMSQMPPEAGEALAEQIRLKISQLRFSSNPEVIVTASIGVHTCKFRNDLNYDPDLQKFIDLSDQQVYTAKRNGKNQVRASRQE